MYVNQVLIYKQGYITKTDYYPGMIIGSRWEHELSYATSVQLVYRIHMFMFSTTNGVSQNRDNPSNWFIDVHFMKHPIIKA